MLKWKIINKQYIDFLRNNYENRIPNIDYGSNHIKPFFGELFEMDDFIYVTQVSSPKPKHNTLKDSLDFIKVKQSDGRLIAVVNLNYMFPVPKNEVCDLEYKDIDKYVVFPDNKRRSQYIKLLQTEIKIIRTLSLEEKAQKLYFRKQLKPDDVVSLRCFDFIALQNAAYDWMGIEHKEVHIINKSGNV